MNRTPVLLGLMTLLLFCAAPTPGDVGGCGQQAEELDPGRFFELKASIDCDRCGECGLSTNTCRAACARTELPSQSFPADCLPLVHDGEVCLRALLFAGCDDYSEYMADRAPRAPTECDFCPGSAQ
jgi:hypothetical protein